MSWVKIDDGAYEHQKLLDAGIRAAWLWVCCLSYCNGQKRRDGVVPRAKVGAMYPGLSKKDAERLVEVGLLEPHPLGYLIHDYHEYQPSESLSDARSMAGKQGGIKSGEARRTKREAIASSNPEASNEAPSHPLPSDPVPSPPDPSQAGHVRPRARGERPRPRPNLLAQRIEPRLYEPLPEHFEYAQELGKTREMYESALRDLRDKFGSKLHDEPWLDDKFCSFIEASGAPRAARSEPQSRADAQLTRQLQRVAELEAQERETGS